jgi:pimeloyl-ACP methyl ester carboxylesterase
MIYIAFIIFTVLVLAFVFYQWQYFMIFSPTYHRDENISDSCEMLSIITKDKKELEGIVYEPDKPNATLLFFAGRSHDSVGVINKLADAYPQTRIISFNYRSYGKSAGEANEKNILNDGLKIAELVQKNYGDFYLLGFSLGSSVAAYIASKKKTKALFLVGAFDSIASLARTKFKFAKLLRYNFPTIEFVSKVDAQTYLFASKADETTYIENARVLKRSIKNLVFYAEVDDLTHKELLWDESVIEKINEVINAKNTPQ